MGKIHQEVLQMASHGMEPIDIAVACGLSLVAVLAVLASPLAKAEVARLSLSND